MNVACLDLRAYLVNWDPVVLEDPLAVRGRLANVASEDHLDLKDRLAPMDSLDKLDLL